MTKNKWLNRWIVCRLENFHFAVAVICVMLYAAGMIAEEEKLKRAGYAGAFVLILVFFVHKHLHAQYEFLRLHSDVDRLPVGQMKQVGGIFMGIFLAALSALLAVVPFLDGDRILSYVGNVIRVIVQFLISFLEPGSSEADIQQGQSAPRGMMPELPPVERGWLAEFLDKVATIAGYCIIAALVLYLLYLFFQKVKYWLRPRSFDDDEKVFLKPELFSELLDRKKEKREKRLWMDFSYNGRVRKWYKKAVQQKNVRKKKIPFSASPSEIEAIAGFEEHEAAQRKLHMLYEKARYSEHGCGREDIVRYTQYGKENGR